MSNIEWTDETWNPVTGCTKISPGCDNCYAEKIALRFKHNFPKGFNVDLKPERLTQPDKWRKPRRIFVNSMSDLFHPDIPYSFIDRVISTMNRCPRHEFQVLTKRPKSALKYFNDRIAARITPFKRVEIDGPTIPSNMWIGTSVEDVERLRQRFVPLIEIPAAIHFLSIEPLLEDVANQLNFYLKLSRSESWPRIDWVIVGGESGPGARQMREEWVLSIRDVCREQNVKFFFKQWGGRNKSEAGRELDGELHNSFPTVHPAYRS